MKLNITKEWLLKKLTQADDSSAGASGTSLDELRSDAQRRTVTPDIFVHNASQFGLVVRFVREQRGWSHNQLATVASIDEAELVAIETEPGRLPSPRALVLLADALGLSKQRLKELVGFVQVTNIASNDAFALKFAANSKNIRAISDEEYNAVRVLVQILSEDDSRI